MKGIASVLPPHFTKEVDKGLLIDSRWVLHFVRSAHVPKGVDGVAAFRREAMIINSFRTSRAMIGACRWLAGKTT